MKNMAASVRALLAKRAKQSGRPFQEVLQHYGLERFLYRFSKIDQRDDFILKGALMLRVWNAPMSRPTRDIDLLAFGENSVELLESTVRKACEVTVAKDGLRFDPTSVSGSRIKEGADYEGVRLRFEGFLEKARIPMQIDIGFGDIVHPGPSEVNYPTILDFPAPILRAYPRESVVAEKFQAMVLLGRLNSRMKDFFDIWLLARQYDFDGRSLAMAIEKTFKRRKTEIDTSPMALTPTFTSSEQAQKQWAAFVRRSDLSDAPASLDEIRPTIAQFLLPVAEALTNRAPFRSKWSPPGPWTRENSTTP